MFLNNYYFKINVRVYELKHTKRWMIFNKKYNIIGIGKTTRIAKQKFLKQLNEKLKNGKSKQQIKTNRYFKKLKRKQRNSKRPVWTGSFN